MKNKVCLKKIFLSAGKSLILAFLILSAGMPVAFADENVTNIKIENAQKTEYKKNEETGDDEIVLTGAVSISVSKDGTETKITASKIVFNRATNMVYAEGAVTLKQTGGASGTQDISAETLLFNTETMEGIFDNGKAIQASSDAINLPSGSKIFVSSEMFGRDSSQTVVFKNATMTFCDEEDPHWKIWASKIWLLPGNEFAFLNAVLFIGHVPVMYLPAFYYPKDELIFNPSFGYDKRKGYFFNTTTYLIGRKPLDTSTGKQDDAGAELFNFMKSNTLKEQVREGLVLHNLEEDYKGDTSTYLKVMADYYTNFGGMVGIEGAAKPNEFLTSANGFFKIGFSRTLFYNATSDSYIPYSSAGKMYNDGSSFLGLKLPFRYAGSINLRLDKPFSFSLAMPFYSDPFFKGDFDDRSEYMDWIGFLTRSGSESNSSSSSQSTISSFSWNANASYTIPLPEASKPYISNPSVSASSSLVFSSMSASSLPTTDNWRTNTPERMFYYPSQITPLKISSKIGGTIFSYSSKSVEAPSSKTPPEFKIPLSVPDEFDANKIAEKTDEKNQQEKNEQGKNQQETEPRKNLALKESDFPNLEASLSSSVQKIEGLKFDLGYSVEPQFTSQINYSATNLTCSSDFKWTDLQSTYWQIKVPANLSGKLSYRGDFLSVSTSLLFSPLYQTHPNLDGYSETSAASVRKSDYSAFSMNLAGTTTVSFSPLIYTKMFKGSSLTWSNSAKILRTEFLGDADNPEWKFHGLDVTDSNSVTAHSLSGTFSAVEDTDFSQTLTLTSNLPPQNDSYSATLKLVFPYITTSISNGVSSSKNSSGEKIWKPDLFKQSLTANFFTGTKNALTFNESFNFNWETFKPDALKLSLSWNNLSLAFVMSTSYKYNFDVDTGWVAESEKQFLADNISLSYTLPGQTFKWFDEKLVFTPSLNTSIVFDCIRQTNSYFRFAPSITFKINDVLDLTFSSESKNSVIYRYFQGLANNGIQIPGETNIFIDLLNSFAFWGDDCFFDPEQTKRKSSGFKLKNLKVTATHNLHDWDLMASFSVSPRLVTDGGRKQYNFDPSITLSVAWRPMSSMKTEIVDKYGEWTLNP